MQLILASSSTTRAAMLLAAGVPVEAKVSSVDETTLKKTGRAQGKSAAEVALSLACAKAMAVSGCHDDALVIGADQMLDCAGEWFDKPKDIDGARNQLRRLRGRVHSLETCATCVVDRQIVWTHGTRSTLTMRQVSDAFIDSYLNCEGSVALESVGAYRLEGLGAQLFDSVDGDFFSILGLPLLALLNFLRQVDVLPS